MILVSIIVPVYNTANYLEQCVNSVLRQSYLDWELLLLNDGSTDSSGEICDKYSMFDNRIRVVHKRNTGVSDTRNLGINMSSGKYVMFLDSDDYWVDYTFLSEWMRYAEESDLDIVRGEYVEVNPLGEELNKSSLMMLRCEYENEIMDNCSFLQNIVKNEYFSVLCLFKKEYILNLRFNINRVFLEDAEFYISLLQNAGRCIYTSKIFYSYRKHPAAVSMKYQPQKMRDAFNFTRFCFSQAEKVQDGNYKRYCMEEGIRNYLFDISVIADSISTNKNLDYCIQEYNLNELRTNVVRIIIKYKFFRYLVGLLSLSHLIRYFSFRHQLRVLIKGY